MFSAYMEEVNLKKFIIFNLLYLHFCFGPQICIGNSSLRICGVVTWHSSVRNTTLLDTHIIHPSHFTKNFSHHTTCSSHATFWLRHHHEPRQTNLCSVLFQSTNLYRHFHHIFNEGDSRISI